MPKTKPTPCPSELRSFTKRDVRLLDADELRLLVRIMDNTNESFNTGRDETEVMDAQGILDLHWAAEDNGGWDGFEAWWSEERMEALKAWNRIQKRAQS